MCATSVSFQFPFTKLPTEVHLYCKPETVTDNERFTDRFTLRKKIYYFIKSRIIHQKHQKTATFVFSRCIQIPDQSRCFWIQQLFSVFHPSLQSTLGVVSHVWVHYLNRASTHTSQKRFPHLSISLWLYFASPFCKYICPSTMLLSEHFLPSVLLPFICTIDCFLSLWLLSFTIVFCKRFYFSQFSHFLDTSSQLLNSVINRHCPKHQPITIDYTCLRWRAWSFQLTLSLWLDPIVLVGEYSSSSFFNL